MNGVTVYAVYQESLKRIKDGRGDYRDDVIVSQWDTAKGYKAQRDDLKKELQVQQRKISELTYYVDILESRDELEDGPSNVGVYLAGLSVSSGTNLSQ